MQFDAGTSFDFFATTGYLLVALALIGTPVKLVLRRFDISAGRAVSAPVIGVAIVVIGSWYWALPLGATKTLPRVLLLAGTLVTAGWAIWVVVRRGAAGTILRDARFRQSAILMAICVAGIGATVVANHAQLLIRESPTVLSLGNNDAAAYALVGQHLLDDGPEDPGNIEGYDAGEESIRFPTGALAVLAAAASVSGREVWRVMEPMMFVTLVLGAYATALLVREALQQLPTVAIGIMSVVGFSVLYTTYLVGNWFYAQMLGVVLITTVTTILLCGARDGSRRDRLVAVSLLALTLAAGFAVYPHMIVLGSLILFPVAAIAVGSIRALVRRALTSGLLLACGLVLAVAVTPGLAADAVGTTRELQGVQAGWPLPFIYPSEMVGIATAANVPPAWPTVVVSALLLLGLAGAALVSWRRGFAASVAPLAAGLVTILASYVVVYLYEGGPTYQQWKWITTFVPIVVVFALGLVLLAAFTMTQHRDLWRRLAYGGLIGYAAIVVFVFASGAGFPLRIHPSIYLSVSPDQVDLSAHPRLEELDALHIDTTPYWDTMWLAYFLRDKQLSLGPDNYYATSEPVSPWSIQRNDAPLPPGTDAVPLNATYRLVRSP
jgi:hypothetical protein